MAQIRLVIAGADTTVLNFPEGSTLADLKEMVDLNPGVELKISGQPVDDSYVLVDGQTIIGAANAKGN